MRRLTVALISLLITTSLAEGETFKPTAIAPELGIGKLTKSVARDQLDRELFSNPYSGVVIANIDIYEKFPFLESRYFQIVSDPGWDRLLMGETGKGLFAFDGEGSAFGKISEPRGLALGENGRIYLADTGNNRILVLDSHSEFDRIDLVPVETIEGLSRPYDVSFSNGGTPDDPADDRLYVAEAGRNRVSGYALLRQRLPAVRRRRRSGKRSRALRRPHGPDRGALRRRPHRGRLRGRCPQPPDRAPPGHRGKPGMGRFP